MQKEHEILLDIMYSGTHCVRDADHLPAWADGLAHGLMLALDDPNFAGWLCARLLITEPDHRRVENQKIHDQHVKQMLMNASGWNERT